MKLSGRAYAERIHRCLRLSIAIALSLSPKTVETYRARMMEKLDIHDFATLVKFAIQHGVTSLE